MRFRLNHREYDLTREEVEVRLRGVEPEPGQKHFVLINGRAYPVKQVIEVALNIPRTYKSVQARRVLRRLDFTLIER